MQQLRIATELLSAKKSSSASLVFPMIFKRKNVDLSSTQQDSTPVVDLKHDRHKGLEERFGLSSGDLPSHPFLIAVALDPATKGCQFLPDTVRTAA